MIKDCFLFIILLSLCFSACEQSNSTVSGKPYDILKHEVYNELQKSYSSISDFELGTATVLKHGKYGLINSQGKEVLPCQYDTIYPVSSNCRVIGTNNLFGLADAAGKLCISCSYEDVKKSENKNYFPFKMNGKWGFISKDEATIIQFKYDDVSHITDSTFIAKINGKYGLLNYTDEFILEPKYDKIIYKIMNKVTDPSYVFLNGKLAILNSKNEFVTNFEYSGELPYYGLPQEDKYVMISKEVASQYSFDKHRYGLIEYETGNIVIPCEYERLGNIAEGLICAKKNDNYGSILR